MFRNRQLKTDVHNKQTRTGKFPDSTSCHSYHTTVRKVYPTVRY